MPVTPERLEELYDRLSLRLTKGTVRKLVHLAGGDQRQKTATIERLISEAYEKSTRDQKKEHRKG